MEYEVFERDFISRTLKLVKTYKGHYEVTLLINCLLGLIVLPKERLCEKIPEYSLDSAGKLCCIKPENENVKVNLKSLIYRMRHSVSHLDIDVKGDKGEIKSICFKRQKGRSPRAEAPFDASFTVVQLRKFVVEIFAPKLLKLLEKGQQDGERS